MPNLPQLPNVQLGNLASDLSSGAANLIAGLTGEKEKQKAEARQARLDAMSKALQEAQMGNLQSEEQNRLAQQQQATAELAERTRSSTADELFRQQQLNQGQDQFQQMYKLHQRQTSAEELRAQAAWRAASARLPAGVQSQLRYMLNNSRANLANLRSLAEQQMQAEMKNPALAQLRAQNMAPAHIDYESQIQQAQQEYEDLLQQMSEGGEAGGAQTRGVSPPPNQTPGPFGSAPVPSGQSAIHGGAQTPAGGTPVVGQKSPVAGTQAGAVKQTVTSGGNQAGNRQARYNELRDSGMSPEQAHAQLRVEGLE